MTKEELKNTYSMKDVIGKYGLFPNRAGFVSCPFHYGDHTASLKIYKDSFRNPGGNLSETNILIKACDLPVSKKNADEGKREAKRRRYEIS